AILWKLLWLSNHRRARGPVLRPKTLPSRPRRGFRWPFAWASGRSRERTPPPPPDPRRRPRGPGPPRAGAHPLPQRPHPGPARRAVRGAPALGALAAVPRLPLEGRPPPRLLLLPARSVADPAAAGGAGDARLPALRLLPGAPLPRRRMVPSGGARLGGAGAPHGVLLRRLSPRHAGRGRGLRLLPEGPEARRRSAAARRLAGVAGAGESLPRSAPLHLRTRRPPHPGVDGLAERHWRGGPLRRRPRRRDQPARPGLDRALPRGRSRPRQHQSDGAGTQDPSAARPQGPA